MGSTVILGSCNGLIHGVDRATGKARWKYDARQDGGRPEFHGTPLIAGDLVVVSSDDRRPDGVGFTYAIDASTGRVRWKARIGRGSMTDVVRLDALLYVVSLDNELIALSLSGGAQAWSYRGGPPDDPEFLNVLTTPAVGTKQVYFGGVDGIVSMLAADSGELRWRSSVGSRVVTSVALTADALYVGTRDGRLLRLARSDGRRVAEMKLGQILFGAPTIAAGSLLVFSAEGDSSVLNAFDAYALTARWARRAAVGWTSTRPHMWKGSVLAGSQGEMSLLRVEDGAPMWTRRLDGVIRGIGDDGDLLYAGTQGGLLCAVKPPTVKEER